MKKLGKTLYDFITDANGDGDEKRILGIALIVAAVVYLFLRGDIGGFSALAGFGGGLLGLGVVGDKVNGQTSPPENTQQGTF